MRPRNLLPILVFILLIALCIIACGAGDEFNRCYSLSPACEATAEAIEKLMGW